MFIFEEKNNHNMFLDICSTLLNTGDALDPGQVSRDSNVHVGWKFAACLAVADETGDTLNNPLTVARLQHWTTAVTLARGVASRSACNADLFALVDLTPVTEAITDDGHQGLFQFRNDAATHDFSTPADEDNTRVDTWVWAGQTSWLNELVVGKGCS